MAHIRPGAPACNTTTACTSGSCATATGHDAGTPSAAACSGTGTCARNRGTAPADRRHPLLIHFRYTEALSDGKAPRQRHGLH